MFFVLSRFGQAWNAESGVSLWLPQFTLLLQGDGFTIFAAAGVTWAAPMGSSEVGFSSVARARVKLNEGFIQGGGVSSEHQPSLACGKEVQELSEARCLSQQRDCSEVSLWLRTLLLRKFVEFTRCDSRTGLRWRLQVST